MNKYTSPGLSSVPANKDPTITVLAPAPIALAISPENFMPPSAIIVIPSFFASSAHSKIAENCGTPIPATTLVVHMEPGPIPTLTQSAPASINAFVASLVATFPAITSILPNFFIFVTVDITLSECPWAVSTTSTSTPASINISALAIASSPTPIAAPTLNLPLLSLVAFGYSWLFSMSLTVINPVHLNSSSTTINFSILCL